ncbi:unannotated protein [freshwater metagenome]|uniref:Unannotated protein n=1 Tax=freshwater metagenome TaxID=449393 RepID=A0A6J6VBN2_9ZZZZ|nr:YggS family pyridoxal phosphate-dependent enzyme [Actinomycetota bacterium]MTB04378.1 YggS family pyridoxal phosphate-dependent enzyme [Actinomycetota bacterium]
MTRHDEISENLAKVQERMAAAAKKVGRTLDEITLIAVTKTFPVSDVEILKSLGVTNFGENREADAAPKAATIAGTWHFQGQIQSNKLKAITSWAHVIHSLDQLRHFEIIENIAPRSLGIFCQVSLDGAQGRGGLQGEKLYELAQKVAQSARHKLLGLMAVAPLGAKPDEAFAELCAIHKAFIQQFPEANQLSAGMSGDFEQAIAHGATHVRIGSSILGSR